MIGIEAIKDLLQEEWFGWMLAGFAFGGALGLLRERDALVATLQKLVMVVLAVLAPVLAVALAAFLLSLPFTGLKGLWESDIPATPMLLLAGAGAILLVNAVIGDGRDERSPNIWLRRAALILLLCILPLAILAALSMGERIGQYGWTPERIWGVVAVAHRHRLRRSPPGGRSTRAARISTIRCARCRPSSPSASAAWPCSWPCRSSTSARSAPARSSPGWTSGKVKAEEFDWTAMAFDFGPAGREHLAEIAKSGPADVARTRQGRAQERKSLFAEPGHRERRAAGAARPISSHPVARHRDDRRAEGCDLPRYDGCKDKPCALLRLDANRLLLVNKPYEACGPTPRHRSVRSRPKDNENVGERPQPRRAKADLAKATIEIRPVERRQLYVDGKPVGDPFE